MSEIGGPQDLRRWCLEQAMIQVRCGSNLTTLEIAEQFYQYVMSGPVAKEPVKQAA